MSLLLPVSSRLRLLHLEDSPLDAELIRRQIEVEWPDCEIKRVDTKDAFIGALHDEDFDLILSDYSLPGFNGLDALRLVRRSKPILPFLFLSGTIGEDNAIQALLQGANDYVIKDRPARLIPAMQTALARQREHELQRQSEQQLLEQAELLDKARDAICVADLGGTVTYWNHSASLLFGWMGHDKGRQLHDLFALHDPKLLSGAMQELLAGGAWTGELQLTGADGQLRHILSRWTLVRDNSQQPKSILLINTDVTEEKKLESQLLRTQRLESIGTLAGGIAHDLNNVLTPILMAVNLLRMELTDVNLLRMVDIMEKSAQQGAGLIRQILAFARGTEGERAELQLHLIIYDVVSLLRETLPRAISIQTDVPRDLWPVLANSTQLSQVFMNLGVNARDAMAGSGQLRIGASNVTVDAALAQANPGAHPGPHVRVAVSDTGSGIPPELLQRIFDPFFTTKVAGKGTGLGLSTMLGILKGHGGFLQVHSEPGRGTEFSLYFPAVLEQTATPTGALPTPPPSGRGETILVIDDENAMREIARTLLEAQGYRVLTAENGTTGLALYREHRATVSVVLIDLMLSGIQGAEVIKELRTLNPDVRVVAMSGVGGEEPGVGEESGRLIFLAKPMTGDDLIRAVQTAIVAPAT